MFKSGYIALLGAPNAGKSTLLNAILKEKIAAVTDKPQTTRKRLKGIYSTESCQMIFLDTPGIHESEKKLNQFMFQEIEEVISDADILCYLLPVDQKISPLILKVFEKYQKKYPAKSVIVVETKIDLERGVQQSPMTSISCRLSALTGAGLETFLKILESLLPEGPVYYPEDELTDENLRALASEIIREKVMDLMRQEIPYSTAVEVIAFKEEPTMTRIEAHIIVEQESQKGMVIGKGGSMIKDIGSQARKEIETLVGTKVFLELKVKVDKNWTKNAAKLARYGYKTT